MSEQESELSGQKNKISYASNGECMHTFSPKFFNLACVTAAAYFYLVQSVDKILQRVKLLTVYRARLAFQFYKGLYMHEIFDSISMS